MSNPMIKIGDRIKVERSDYVPDGTYKVLEVLDNPPRRRGVKRYHVKVLSPHRRHPDWEPMGWWVEDVAIVGASK